MKKFKNIINYLIILLNKFYHNGGDEIHNLVYHIKNEKQNTGKVIKVKNNFVWSNDARKD